MSLAYLVSRIFFNILLLVVFFAVNADAQQPLPQTPQQSDGAAATASPTPANTQAGQIAGDPHGNVSVTATPAPSPAANVGPTPVRSGRILGVIPNFRTIEEHSSQR